jgi:hypothetical protein
MASNRFEELLNQVAALENEKATLRSIFKELKNEDDNSENIILPGR